MLSLPAVTVYTFRFLTVNLVQAHSEILPLPSSVRTITCLSEEAKKVSSFHLAHKYQSSHLTAIDTSSQSSREIRGGINHFEFTLKVITQVTKSTPWDEAHWTKTLFNKVSLFSSVLLQSCHMHAQHESWPQHMLTILWFSPHSVQYKFLNTSCSESFFAQNCRVVQCLIPPPPPAFYSWQFLSSLSKQLWFKGHYSTSILLQLSKPPNTHMLPSGKNLQGNLVLSYASQAKHLSVVKSDIHCKRNLHPPSRPSDFHGVIPEFQLYPNIMSCWKSSLQGNTEAGLSPMHHSNLIITLDTSWQAATPTYLAISTLLLAPDCKTLVK